MTPVVAASLGFLFVLLCFLETGPPAMRLSLAVSSWSSGFGLRSGAGGVVSIGVHCGIWLYPDALTSDLVRRKDILCM